MSQIFGNLSCIFRTQKLVHCTINSYLAYLTKYVIKGHDSFVSAWGLLSVYPFSMNSFKNSLLINYWINLNRYDSTLYQFCAMGTDFKTHGITPVQPMLLLAGIILIVSAFKIISNNATNQ